MGLLGGVWFRSLVERSGSIPLLRCLVEMESSGVVPQKRIFSQDAETADSKKSAEPTRSCLLRHFPIAPFLPHRHEHTLRPELCNHAFPVAPFPHRRREDNLRPEPLQRRRECRALLSALETGTPSAASRAAPHSTSLTAPPIECCLAPRRALPRTLPRAPPRSFLAARMDD
jgi:hypothetical protein